MTTLTATPDLPGMSCALVVDAATPSTAVVIWRDDVNGTRAVRQQLGATTDATGALTVTDHEAALTGDLVYRLEVSGTAAATAATVTLADPTRAPGLYLHVAADPTLALGPLALTGRRLSIDAGAQLHQVIGRGDLVDTGGRAHMRVGDLEILHADWDEAHTLETLIAPRDVSPQVNRTVMLRQAEHAGMDGLYRVTRLAADPTRGRRWITTLSVDEALAGPPLRQVP